MRNKMLLICLATIAGLAVASDVYAGKGKGRGHDGDGKNRPFPSKEMVKELKLTDPQVTELKTLHEKHKTSKVAIQTKMKDAREALQAAMKKDAPEAELRELHNKVKAAQQEMADQRFGHVMEVRNLLTAEQRKNFQGMKYGKKGKSHGECCGESSGGHSAEKCEGHDDKDE